MEKFFKLMEAEEVARHSWLKHLHLLAAGALTVLAAMDTGSGVEGTASSFLLATWGSLGLAILSGGVALAGETTRLARIRKALLESIAEAPPGSPAGVSVPIVVAKPAFLVLVARGVFLMSLAVATICLVCYAMQR